MADKPFIALLITEDAGNGLLTTISEIPLDVRKTSTYEFTAEITKLPVENGSTISDHRRVLPPVIHLEGFVSDSPLVSVSTGQGSLKGDILSTAGVASACQGAYDALKAAHKNGTPLTVVAEYEIFEDMLIENMTFPRDAEKGLGLWFSLSLAHVSIVQSLTAALSADVVKRLKRKKSPKGAGKLTKAQRKLVTQMTNQNRAGASPKISTKEADRRVAALGEQQKRGMPTGHFR